MTKTPMLQARLEVETRDSVLVVRLDGGPLGLIGLDMAEKLSDLPRNLPPGRPPKLDRGQRRRLERLLLRGARAAGYESDLWTCPRIAELAAASTWD